MKKFLDENRIRMYGSDNHARILVGYGVKGSEGFFVATSDGGLILVRELDERLGFDDLIAQHLTDSRRGKNTQIPRVK